MAFSGLFFFFLCCGSVLPCYYFIYIFIFSNIFFIFLILFYFLFFVIVLSFSFFFFFVVPHTLQDLSSQAELQWWEGQVQTAGLTENLRAQGIFISVRSPRSPYLNTKTSLYPTACKLQCWTPQAKQPAIQEHSPTHQKKWDDNKICYRWRCNVKNSKTK